MKKIIPSRIDNSIKSAAIIASVYLILSAIWIFVSDTIVNSLSLPQETSSNIEMIKGWGFVLLSAILFFFFLKSFAKQNNLTDDPIDNIKSDFKSAELKSRRKDWFDPLIIIAIFILIFGLFLWIFYLNSVKNFDEELEADSISASEIIALRLQGNEEYFKLLTAEMSSGILDDVNFLLRTSEYVKDHKELINITLVDSNYRIITASPAEKNKQIIGLEINLPEPKRATKLAAKTKNSVYTYPFEAIQGNPSFEIWVPVFNQEKLLGFIAGVYSCRNTIKYVLPNQVKSQNHVGLYSKEGGLLGESNDIKSTDRNYVKTVPLKIGNGMYLVLSKYTPAWWNWEILFLGILSIVLLIALGYGILLLKRDIKEKIKTQKALLASENKYRSIFENSIDAILLMAPDGKILSANPAACKMFVRTEDELLQVGRSGIIDLNDPHTKQLFDSRNQKGKMRGELFFFRKDGSRFPAEVSSTLFTDDNGQTRISNIIRDITERKIIEEDLIKAKEKAELSDKIKTEFVAQMSHEIRTPLNVLMSYSSILKDEINSEKNEELNYVFEGITNAGIRIIRTVDLLLNISELQANAYDPDPKQIDIYSDILLHVFTQNKHFADEKKLEFNLLKQTDQTILNVDEYSLFQIIINLVDNAIKYTEKGKVEIRCLRNNFGLFQIEIEDTGIGMSDEYLAQIYSPFTQEDTGYTRRFEGNGLGLSLVKQYCKIDNISIDVKSKKNAGTKFTLVFTQ